MEEQAKSSSGESERGTRPGVRPQAGEPGTAVTGSATSEVEMMELEMRDVQKVRSPTGGRGDPTSTMLWSPRKHAGCKRSLGIEEAEFLEEEGGSGSEGAEAKPETERPASVSTDYQASKQETGDQRENEGREAARGAVTTNLLMVEVAPREETGPGRWIEAATPGQT